MKSDPALSAHVGFVAAWTIKRLRRRGVHLPKDLSVLVGSLDPFKKHPNALGIYFFDRRLIALDPARIAGPYRPGDLLSDLVVRVVGHECAHAIAGPSRQAHGRKFRDACRIVAKPLGLAEPPKLCRSLPCWPPRPQWFSL